MTRILLSNEILNFFDEPLLPHNILKLYLINFVRISYLAGVKQSQKTDKKSL